MPKSILNLDQFNKAALAGGIFLIGIALFYYLVIYLPGWQSTKEQAQTEIKTVEDKERCREVGTKVYNAHKSKYEDLGWFVGESKYAFSKSLNTCLISLYWSKESEVTGEYTLRRQVQDSLTGQMIIVFERHNLEVFICGDLRTDPPKKCDSEGTYVTWEEILMGG